MAAGFPVHGLVQNTLVVALRPGKTLELTGDFQVRDLVVDYTPLFQPTGLTGTLHYHKRLELRASATPPVSTPGGVAVITVPRSTAPQMLKQQLRVFAPQRDGVIIEHLTVGPLNFSATALNTVFKGQTLAVGHFQTNVLGGVIAGSLYAGELDQEPVAKGVRLRSEFAQIDLTLLLPSGADSASKDGQISGDLTLQLTLPQDPLLPVDIYAVSMAIHCAHWGPGLRPPLTLS